ncbi:hypothetical protein FQR65_LT17944 [Abscondita terminalis]|nr:hypothetical protein FQR65_LT17944 [Abscondita terminalis]
MLPPERFQHLISQGLSLVPIHRVTTTPSLEDSKLELISQASSNAHLRAGNIAKEAGSSLGDLIKADLGIFQITGQNDNEEYSYGGAFNTTSRRNPLTRAIGRDFNNTGPMRFRLCLAQERKEHDKAWGLDFGDYNETLIVSQQKEYPENLEEHPMSDAYYMKIELTDKGHPVNDLAKARADSNEWRLDTLHKIREFINHHPDVEVFGYHDIEEFDALLDDIK